MTSIIKNLKNHGRETYAVYYGDEFVLKRPLPTFDEETKNKWLAKQHHTKSIIDEIREVKNPLYNIPSMKFINDEEYQILEERAPGVPLTSDVYNSLTKRQQFEIINSVASFLVDMNELKPVGPTQKYHIKYELKFNRLTSIQATCYTTRTPAKFHLSILPKPDINIYTVIFSHHCKLNWIFTSACMRYIVNYTTKIYTPCPALKTTLCAKL